MDPLIIPLAALAIPIFVAPAAMGFKHAAKLRDLDHAERMRAMELGRFNPGDEQWTVGARLSAGIGIAVPIVAMIAAMLATAGCGFHEEIWIAAGVLGSAGVLCGTILACRYVRVPTAAAPHVEKPVYDPEAFDFAGRG